MPTISLDTERLILGIDIGGTKTVAVLGRASGEILAESRLEDWTSGSWEKDVGILVDHARLLMRGAKVRFEQLHAVGACAPGPLNPVTGIPAVVPIEFTETTLSVKIPRPFLRLPGGPLNSVQFAVTVGISEDINPRDGRLQLVEDVDRSGFLDRIILTDTTSNFDRGAGLANSSPIHLVSGTMSSGAIVVVQSTNEDRDRDGNLDVHEDRDLNRGLATAEDRDGDNNLDLSEDANGDGQLNASNAIGNRLEAFGTPQVVSLPL